MAALFLNSPGYSQENQVVLDYNQLTVGYIHQSLDIGDDNLNGNGLGLSASGRVGNFVLSLGVGNTWIEDVDAGLLQIGGGLGYIYEVSETVHLVPSLSIDFERVHDFEYYYGDSWVLTPSLYMNYAYTDNLELSLGVGYADPFNTEILGEDVDAYVEGAFFGGVGFEYAVSENVGLLGSVVFGRNQTAVGAGISWHY